MKILKTSGKNAFPDDIAPDVIIVDYIEFMKMKFNYDSLNSDDKKTIENTIMNHDLVGVEKMKEMIEGEYLFFADGIFKKSNKRTKFQRKKLSQRKKSRGLNIFKLLREKLDFKYIQSKYKDNKNSKKVKKQRKAGKIYKTNTKTKTRKRTFLLE